jgi:ribosomal protein S18 acetylase RimI-like enzyme
MLAERIPAPYSNAQWFQVEGKKAVMIEYRGAVPADADRIVRVIGAVWPGQNVRSTRICSALAEENRSTYLALAAGEVVGFVDGFLTRSDDGRLRWEVDLLAVLPAARGYGIGTELVRSSTAAGLAAGAEFLRALVRIDNVGAKLAFERSGFVVEVEMGVLYVCDCPVTPHERDSPNGLHLVPVSTLMYSGLWLEGRLTDRSFSVAAGECVQRGLDRAGVVIPQHQSHLTQVASAAGYARVGEYHWLRFRRNQFTR